MMTAAAIPIARTIAATKAHQKMQHFLQHDIRRFSLVRSATARRYGEKAAASSPTYCMRTGASDMVQRTCSWSRARATLLRTGRNC